jgi:hypothetical protein
MPGRGENRLKVMPGEYKMRAILAYGPFWAGERSREQAICSGSRPVPQRQPGEGRGKNAGSKPESEMTDHLNEEGA